MYPMFYFWSKLASNSSVSLFFYQCQCSPWLYSWFNTVSLYKWPSREYITKINIYTDDTSLYSSMPSRPSFSDQLKYTVGLEVGLVAVMYRGKEFLVLFNPVKILLPFNCRRVPLFLRFFFRWLCFLWEIDSKIYWSFFLTKFILVYTLNPLLFQLLVKSVPSIALKPS